MPKSRIEIEINDTPVDQKVRSVRIVFGPHYFVEVREVRGRTQFALGMTHNGVMADASEVNGELERLITALRALHPELMVG